MKANSLMFRGVVVMLTCMTISVSAGEKKPVQQADPYAGYTQRELEEKQTCKVHWALCSSFLTAGAADYLYRYAHEPIEDTAGCVTCGVVGCACLTAATCCTKWALHDHRKKREIEKELLQLSQKKHK